MERLNAKNINTPEHMDEVWATPKRVHEMRPCERVGKFLGMFAHGKVLDVGCGNGSYWPYISGDIHGIEFAPRVAAATAKQYPKAHVTIADFRERLPYPDDTFDTVFCGEVVEHLEVPARLLAEIRRVLRPKGLLILTTPFEDAIKCAEHLWAFTVEDVARMLRPFRNVAVFRYGFAEPDDWDHMLAVAQK